MQRLAGLWRSIRRRPRRESTQSDGVDRRTLLTGAAAAGVVAVGASAVNAGPAGAVPRAAASAAVAQQVVGSVAASDVSVVPAGEIVDTDAQAVLEDLDRRLS